MIPILYKANETDFTSNGIGALSDAIRCDVIEERNSIYELEMEYPIDGMYYSEIAEDRYIYATVSDDISDKQPFKIYKITRPINGVVTIYAEHASYLLNKMVVMPFTATSCAEAMDRIARNVATTPFPFEFYTDKNTEGNFKVEEPTPIRGILGGSEGSILDVYGKGEYLFDKFNVTLYTNRGRDNNVVLLYGKNITDLERTTDMTNVYTGIVPYWKGSEGEVVTLSEKVIMSSHASEFSHKIIKVVDFSGDWEDAPSQAQLRTRATNYVNNNEGWKIKDNIKVSFVNLADTEEFKDKASLMRVKLCDTVTVRYTKLGVDVKAKVVKTNWNTLKNRYNEIEIGDTSSNLYTTVIGDTLEVVKQETVSPSNLDKALAHQQKLIQGGLGGYVVMNNDADGTPREILVMNTKDKNTATKVLRINMNGIQFSNGYSATPSTAWTINGQFSGKWIEAGTVSAAAIRGGTLALGGTTAASSYGAGSMAIYGTDNKLIGQWNSGGIQILKGSLQMAKNSISDSANAGVYLGNNGMAMGPAGQAPLLTLTPTGGLTMLAGSIRMTKTSIGDNVNAGLYLGRNGISAGPANKNPFIRIEANTGFLKTNRIYFYDTDDNKNTTYSLRNVNGRIESGGCMRWATDNKTNKTNRIETGGLYVAGNGDGGVSLWCDGNFKANNFNSSDRRFKTNINYITEETSIEFIKKLKPVSYKLRIDKNHPDNINHGLIAQDVEKIVDWNIVNGNNDGKTLEYIQIIPDLVNVNKYLLRKLEARTKEIDYLHKEIEQLKEAVYGKASY